MDHTERTNSLFVIGLPRETIPNLSRKKVLFGPFFKDHRRQDQIPVNNFILHPKHIFAISKITYLLFIENPNP
jgi:hypothetical protein